MSAYDMNQLSLWAVTEMIYKYFLQTILQIKIHTRRTVPEMEILPVAEATDTIDSYVPRLKLYAQMLGYNIG